MKLLAKVLTVSDGVAHGAREDRSGVDSVAGALRTMSEDFAGLIVTTGGTGFGPRDLTPEGTRRVLEREAPGVAEATRAVNAKPGRLSRGVAGTLGSSIVVNTPGSPKGCVEALGAVLDMIPHALSLMTGETTIH